MSFLHSGTIRLTNLGRINLAPEHANICGLIYADELSCS